MKKLYSIEVLLVALGFSSSVLAVIGWDLTCRPTKDFCYGFANFKQFYFLVFSGIVAGVICFALRKFHFPLLSGANVGLRSVILIVTILGSLIGSLLFVSLSV